jgi:hypothetical protein
MMRPLFNQSAEQKRGRYEGSVEQRRLSHSEPLSSRKGIEAHV